MRFLGSNDPKFAQFVSLRLVGSSYIAAICFKTAAARWKPAVVGARPLGLASDAKLLSNGIRLTFPEGP